MDKGNHKFRESHDIQADFKLAPDNKLLSNNNNIDDSHGTNLSILSRGVKQIQSSNTGDGYNKHISNDNFANFDAFSNGKDLFETIKISEQQNSTQFDASICDNLDRNSAADFFEKGQQSRVRKKNDDTPNANNNLFLPKANDQIKNETNHLLNQEGELFADFSKADIQINNHFTFVTAMESKNNNPMNLKFQNDYSKLDDFDVDLKKILERSILDQ